MKIIKVDPRVCTRWEYADRNSFEFGDINSLAEDIKRNGQVTPVFVRPLIEDDRFKYEVIAGSRRMQACLTANMTLDAIVVEVSDLEAATIQIKENEQLNLSEYSKGISYAKLKRDGKLTQEQLAVIVGCSRKKIQSLLSFEKVDSDIWDAVTNMTKVSARSAETILALSKKSDAHKEAIIEIAEEIRKGAGSVRIEKLVNAVLHGEFNTHDTEEVSLPNGQVIASWRKGGVFFAKNINLDKKKFNKLLIEFFRDKKTTEH